MTISKTLYPLSHAFSVMKHIFCVFYLFISYSSYAHALKIGPTDPKVFGLFPTKRLGSALEVVSLKLSLF
jgi:hypothetical protein